MQIPDDIRKCVVFIFAKRQGKVVPFGTGLLARLPILPNDQKPEASVGLNLVLTANHVIAQILSKSDDDIVRIRYNTKSGLTEWFDSNASNWSQPDASVDLAFFGAWPFSHGDLDGFPWNVLDVSATDKVMSEVGIGLGDEVFAVGLFRSHTNTDINEPIVRVGNIAAIPLQPVTSADFGPMKAILVETRSIGGLSGSPVFVYLGSSRMVGASVTIAPPKNPFLFLGLLHGHYDISKVLADSSVETTETDIHTGIGIVIPAQEVINSLMIALGPSLPKARENLEALRRAVTESDEAGAQFGGPEQLNRLRALFGIPSG